MPRTSRFVTIGGRQALALLSLVALAVLSAAARAQEITRELGFAMTPAPKSLIEKAKELLALDEDQTDTLKDLYQGYRAAYRSTVEESDAKRRQMYEKARDSSSGIDSNRKNLEMLKKTLADIERLDETFVEDVRALLSADQLEKFEHFERARRRESTNHSSMLSGEGADPIAILQHLKIDAGKLPDFAALSAEYAEALDRHVLARQQIWRSGYDAYLGGDQWQKVRENYPRLYVVSKQIKDLNRRFARQVSEMLTEEDRAKFEEEFKRRSFPQIYKESIIAKRLKAARGLEDLNETQKEQLDSLEKGYDRDAEAINARWRGGLDRAQDQIVASGNRGWNSSEAQTVRDCVEERKTLDRKYLDRIDAVLTEAQASRLPATTRELPRLRNDALPDWDRDAVRRWLKDE